MNLWPPGPKYYIWLRWVFGGRRKVTPADPKPWSRTKSFEQRIAEVYGEPDPSGGPIFHHSSDCGCRCKCHAAELTAAQERERELRTALEPGVRVLGAKLDALNGKVAAMEAVVSAATDLLDWIVQMPSHVAIVEGCNTEANQVHHTPDQKWELKGSETQRHWLDHVGPAIQAAFDAERAATEYPAHPRWKLRSALMAVWTEGRHTFNPNTGKCVCGKDWLCDMDDDQTLGGCAP